MHPGDRRVGFSMLCLDVPFRRLRIGYRHGVHLSVSVRAKTRASVKIIVPLGRYNQVEYRSKLSLFIPFDQQ